MKNKDLEVFLLHSKTELKWVQLLWFFTICNFQSKKLRDFCASENFQGFLDITWPICCLFWSLMLEKKGLIESFRSSKYEIHWNAGRKFLKKKPGLQNLRYSDLPPMDGEGVENQFVAFCLLCAQICVFGSGRTLPLAHFELWMMPLRIIHQPEIVWLCLSKQGFWKFHLLLRKSVIAVWGWGGWNSARTFVLSSLDCGWSTHRRADANSSGNNLKKISVCTCSNTPKIQKKWKSQFWENIHHSSST